ncbi:MAG: HWE histidine kinase domain-containing protein, partial [Hyphomicrobiaceae bacterium]
PALWCATHTDITERRNLGHRLRQLARVIELSHEAMLVWDLEDGIVLWNRGCEELYGYRRSEAVGRTSHDLLATGHPGGMEAFMHALRHDGEWSGELCHTASDGEQVWVESRQELIRAGGRDLVLETNRDITERRKSDAIRNLLVAELNHRVKNTLAIVQSLAAQTARTQPDMASFMTSFTGRLQSLAAAQTILSDAQWAGASLRDLVISQLATTIGSDRQTQLSGADVFLPPQPALQLTLILHELATNAVQHGALTRPTGHVEITWSVGPGPKPEVALDWIESGGPEVSASAGKGLGRELIERLGRLPHLRARLELARDGVRCRVTTRTDDGIASGLDGYFDPTREGTAGAMRSRRRRPRSESGRRILVVEENALDALLIEEALADAGYLVIGPLRSREAVERALADHTFDLAIVDIDSVAIGGQGIAEGMIARGIPCIPVTARPDSDPADAPPAGETLRKPIGCAQLLALVSGRLRSK